MVRGLFLMPIDGPFSQGGYDSSPPGDDDPERREDQDRPSSDREQEKPESKPPSTVAEIIAACEAPERRAKEMQDLASRKSDAERDPDNPAETQAAQEEHDGGAVQSAHAPAQPDSENPDTAGEPAAAGDPVELPHAVGADDESGTVHVSAGERDPADAREPEDESSEPDAESARGERDSTTDMAPVADADQSTPAPAETTKLDKSEKADNAEAAMKDRKQQVGGNLRIEFSEEQRAKLKVIGVGGAGQNAVDNMIASHLNGVDFIAVNTDAQALFHEKCLATTKVQIGKEITRGLGAGGDAEIGRRSAEEDLDRLRELFNGADMVFVAAGMGGGTGSGAGPVIAQIARDRGILTIGIVTEPFEFEGRRRRQRADVAIEEMKDAVDTLIVIPNDKVFDLFKEDLPYHEAFRKVDEVLYQGTKGISDIINTRGFINVDFADAKSVMSNAGDAIMGIGVAEGENRAAAAAEAAIDSPLLDNLRIDGARGILINITGDSNVGMKEVQETVKVVTEHAQEDADVYFGLVPDESLGDQLSVTVIATGFNAPQNRRPRVNVEPEVRFRGAGEHGSRRPLKAVGEHGGGKPINGKHGTNGPRGSGEKNGTRDGEKPSLIRVDAEPSFVDEILADPSGIDPNDTDVPAFLRRGRSRINGKR